MKKGVDGETKYTHMTPLEDRDLLKPDFSVLIKKKFFLRGWETGEGCRFALQSVECGREETNIC